MTLKKINIWYASSLLISLVVAIPIVTVFSSFFETTGNYSSILKDTFLYDYIFNSIVLLLGVLLLTFTIGVGCAYIVSFYKFPGVNFFKWALILSFAVPAYIYAYSLTAFFENFGTAFSILKNLFGEGDYNSSIPKFDGMLGAIISISFSLFGYVYVLTRASFHYQSQNLIELGKNLGFSKKKSFFKIILPSARPAIVAGLSLVAMETLSDFGSVSFFGFKFLKSSGGMLFDLCIHDFDMLNFLTGEKIKEVYVNGNVFIEPRLKALGDIDNTIITLELKSGILCSIDSSRQTHYGYDQRIEIFGSKGVISVENKPENLYYFSNQKNTEASKIKNSFIERYKYSYIAELEHFYTCIMSNTKPNPGPENILSAIRVAAAGRKSLETKSPQGVKDE